MPILLSNYYCVGLKTRSLVNHSFPYNWFLYPFIMNANLTKLYSKWTPISKQEVVQCQK